MNRRGFGPVLLGLGAALALIVGNESAAGQHLWKRISDALTRQTYEVPHSWLASVAWRSLNEFLGAVHGLSPGFLAIACVATIGGVLARAVGAARLREGRPDPLEWLRSRPRLQRGIRNTPAALLSLPWLLWTLVNAGELRERGNTLAGWLPGEISGLLASAGIIGLTYLGTRAGLRALLAPLEGESETEQPKNAGEIVFSAVAVTARTRAVVAGFAAATVAMVGLTLTGPSDPRFLWVLAGYMATALSVPFLFQRASRIAVGIDGVWVRDASRTRFFAYRDLDEARARGADLELVAGGRAVLRLQMQGDDAGRRDEVLARVNETLAGSRAESGRAGERVVQAMPRGLVVASAMGADSYRLPSISREQLWDLVEGPASDASTRTAAAEALSVALDDSDRARLRVAASRCAQPRLRVALGTLAGGGADSPSPYELHEESQEGVGERRQARRVGTR